MGLFNLEVRDSVTSTNDLVKQVIGEGAPEGYAVLAFSQSAGYGRQGRIWASPYGGMYLSLLLRPPVPLDRVATAGLVVALAVRSAVLERFPAVEAQVKWPNDIVCAHGKLAGISSEYKSGALCIGIGANVVRPEEGLDVPGKYAPAYLSDASVAGGAFCRRAIEGLARSVLEQLEPRYLHWCACGFEPFADEYRSCLSLTGAEVEVVNRAGDRIAQGEVAGIDSLGRLLVRADGGQLSAVASGEAHIARIGHR